MDSFRHIILDPLVSWPVFGLIIALALIISALSAHKMSSFVLRLLAIFFLALALLAPQRASEKRDSLPDEVLILTDRSDSAQLGGRQDEIAAIENRLLAKLGEDNGLEITRADIPAGTDGTKLMAALTNALGSLPQSRLAGIITITDGQIADVPAENPAAFIPDGVPFHALILDDPNFRDRHIKAITAPQFGLVDETADFTVLVSDPGHEGERALIEVKLNGDLIARFPAIIGQEVTLPVKIEQRGTNTVELDVEPADGELTLKNNVFISEISGIRDRMRVLLVTGEPHRGGRAWRNLLKSDPGVDMVHFTILTTPGVKRTFAAPDELSLIAFPTRQLFEEKLDEFDLIIFDQFTRRSTPNRSGRVRPILPVYYIENIAQYVENGGALLVATGPAFAAENSLYRTPLASVLPARPTGGVATYAFKPRLTAQGKRHPVTADFAGQTEQNWGPWYQIIESDVLDGHVLMEGPDGEPLLVMDRVREGRVGLILSDQAWLWARGYQGGGPYDELFRRLAHWLLGEPDLDGEKLSAHIEGEDVVIERHTLEDEIGPVTVRKPDGSESEITLKADGEGLFRGRTKAAGLGAYRLTNGNVSTITALGTLNPKEFSNLIPTGDILAPVSAARGGLTASISAGNDLPNIRRIKEGAGAAGKNWMGLTAHNAYVTRQSDRRPLAPGLLYFAFAIGLLTWAWREEGR